jgi:hypothetical protein
MTSADTAAELGDASLSARYGLAVANAVMAAIVGTLTLGIGAGIVGALVLAVLPFWSLIYPAVVAWVRENPLGACLGGFLLFWIAGTVVWGLAFAFGIALVLAPTMIVVIVGLTFVKPSAADAH